MEPLVSILIPAFNSERWISDTIKSALAQTWPRKEIIIVDDGSRDQTLQVARRFSSDIVRVVTQANQGAAAARNLAFELCQGDRIQWLDADDLLAPDKIEQQMRAISRCTSPCTLLSSAWSHFVYRTSKAQTYPSSLWCDLSPIEWLLRKLEWNLFMQPATWLVSRELTQAAGPWDARLSLDDDGEYFCRVVRASDGIQFIRDAHVFYRRSGFGSLSHVGFSNRKLESQFLALQLQIACVRSLEDSHRVRTACLKFLEPYLIFFYPERPDLMESAQQLAAYLGGELPLPHLPRKYAMVQKLFGWSAAKRVQTTYNGWKAALIGSWDKAMFHLERVTSSQHA
jgi:glycosyltransferase involved in cell wall biosynthesis